MEITLAKSAGYCFGVSRAIKLVNDALDNGKKVATLGEIIHNADVVRNLEKRGARVVNDIDEVADDEILVIRSHGVGQEIYNKIHERNLECIDATCPFVAKIHKIVREKSDEGYFILIAGDKNHPEVKGIIGHCDQNNYMVFSNDDELKKFLIKKSVFLEKKVAIVAQTTYNIEIWGTCIGILTDTLPNLQIFETICIATDRRQNDAIALAKASDAVVVIGGRHSSNTDKLFRVCKHYCGNVFHIENASELNLNDFRGMKKVGITAGASTPAYIIEEVLTQMSEIQNDENFDFAKALDESFKKIHGGECVKGTIEKVDDAKSIAYVNVGTKHTGIVSLSELTNDPSLKVSDVVKEGDEVEFMVIKVNDQEGIVTLSKKKVDETAGFRKLVQAKENGEILQGKVQKVIKGGIIVLCNGVQVFIPASHTGFARDFDLTTLVGQTFDVKIIEAEEKRHNRAVGSIKEVQKAQKAEAQKKFWDEAEVGKVYKGEVKSLTNYGAFVDLGGIDGMVHISELSWGRIKHPSEVVKVGDVLEVYIKELDKEKNRISLGYKKTEDNPWTKFTNEYSVGDVVKAKIVSIPAKNYGAFAEIIPGVDGLIHISQIANQRVENVSDILSVGQEVEAEIIGIEDEDKRVSLSMRKLAEENNED